MWFGENTYSQVEVDRLKTLSDGLRTLDDKSRKKKYRYRYEFFCLACLYPLIHDSPFHFLGKISKCKWDNQRLVRASPFFGTMLSTWILHENILSTFCCCTPLYSDTQLESLLFFRPFLILFMTPALDTVTVPTISALDTVKSTL